MNLVRSRDADGTCVKAKLREAVFFEIEQAGKEKPVFFSGRPKWFYVLDALWRKKNFGEFYMWCQFQPHITPSDFKEEFLVSKKVWIAHDRIFGKLRFEGDHDTWTRPRLISLNYALFGNFGDEGESSIDYFRSSGSQSAFEDVVKGALASYSPAAVAALTEIGKRGTPEGHPTGPGFHWRR